MARRIVLVVDDRRYRRLTREADRRGASVVAMIHQAIDELFPDEERRRTAVAAILGSDPMPVPRDPADLRRELDATQLAKLIAAGRAQPPRSRSRRLPRPVTGPGPVSDLVVEQRR